MHQISKPGKQVKTREDQKEQKQPATVNKDRKEQEKIDWPQNQYQVIIDCLIVYP